MGSFKVDTPPPPPPQVIPDAPAPTVAPAPPLSGEPGIIAIPGKAGSYYADSYETAPATPAQPLTQVQKQWGDVETLGLRIARAKDMASDDDKAAWVAA